MEQSRAEPPGLSWATHTDQGSTRGGAVADASGVFGKRRTYYHTYEVVDVGHDVAEGNAGRVCWVVPVREEQTRSWLNNNMAGK